MFSAVTGCRSLPTAPASVMERWKPKKAKAKAAGWRATPPPCRLPEAAAAAAVQEQQDMAAAVAASLQEAEDRAQQERALQAARESQRQQLEARAKAAREANLAAAANLSKTLWQTGW